MNKCDKELALRILLILSSMESWAFSTKNNLPDYMHEELRNLIDDLRAEVLTCK